MSKAQAWLDAWQPMTELVLPWRGYRECQINQPLFGDALVDVYAINVTRKELEIFE